MSVCVCVSVSVCAIAKHPLPGVLETNIGLRRVERVSVSRMRDIFLSIYAILQICLKLPPRPKVQKPHWGGSGWFCSYTIESFCSQANLQTSGRVKSFPKPCDMNRSGCNTYY